jgi:hypothetical protein
MGWSWRSVRRGASHALAALGVVLAGLSSASTAKASSFDGRLALGLGNMSTSSAHDYGDSSGPTLLTQLDAGIRLFPALAVHTTLIYDYSSWLAFSDSGEGYPGSMFGFGLGATVALGGLSLGASGGGQFTFFPQSQRSEPRPVRVGERGLRLGRLRRCARRPSPALALPELEGRDEWDRLRPERLPAGLGGVGGARWRATALSAAHDGLSRRTCSGSAQVILEPLGFVARLTSRVRRSHRIRGKASFVSTR